MSESGSKRIACIFESERVFLTKNGGFYGYEVIEGRIKCRKLHNIEINRFLYRMKDDKKVLLWSGRKNADCSNLLKQNENAATEM